VGFTAANLFKQIRRRRAGLASQPLIVLLLWTAIITAISLGAVGYLNSYIGVPTAGVVMLGLIIFFVWLTTHTKFGRYIYAVGGNIEAARRAGINVAAIRIWVFTISGMMARSAVSSSLRDSRPRAPRPAGHLLARGDCGGGYRRYESFRRPRHGLGGALGALVIGSVSNGLDLMSQPPEIKYMVEGAILLLAVTVDALSRRGREAAGR